MWLYLVVMWFSRDCQVINSSSGRCWSCEVYNPCPGVVEGVPSGNDYKGGFATALMTKVRKEQELWRDRSGTHT